MRKYILLAITVLALAACTPGIKRTATDTGFISPSAPLLNFDFQGFAFDKETSWREKRSVKYYGEAYSWDDKENGRSIEINFITMQRRRTFFFEPSSELAKESLCVGTSYIEGKEYRTQVKIHSSNQLIFKSYLSHVADRDFVKIFYSEQISNDEAKKYMAWQSAKNDILYRLGHDVGKNLERKRQETPFKEILEFEKRADAIFNTTNSKIYTTNHTFD